MDRRMELAGEAAVTGAGKPRSGTVVDARMTLALWLKTGRAQRNMSLDDIARITKIQPRILERLEAGKLDGLPAEVFVRGFVRSFAKCVGLDEAEAVRRFVDAQAAAADAGASGRTQVAPAVTARALVESMSELAPRAAGPRHPHSNAVNAVNAANAANAVGSGPIMMIDAPIDVEIAPLAVHAVEIVAPPVVESMDVPVETGKKKRGRRKGRNKKSTSGRIAAGTPAQPTPVVVDAGEVVEVSPMLADAITVDDVDVDVDVTSLSTPVEVIDAVDASSEMWAPKMPTVIAPTVPWRRHAAVTTAAPVVPSLVIDDAEPELAERELEDRVAAKRPTRTFLPPILLDREDRSGRQGGLTLAVIILLIAATLTLSYLMRRPSSSGDGVTHVVRSPDITQLV